MYFELVGEIGDVETIAVGRGRTRRAEVHWYEEHGVGRVRMKIKRFLD